MGEVVSIAKARQTDIFSMFDEACPSLPEETNHGVLETARRSISDGKSNKPSRFRTACLIIGTVSFVGIALSFFCLLYTSPSPRDATLSRMPSSA